MSANQKSLAISSVKPLSMRVFRALASLSLVSFMTLSPAFSAEIWQARQKHGCFGPMVEYLNHDRFKIVFEKTSLVLLADCKSGKASLWNQKKGMLYRGAIGKIALPMSFLAKAAFDLDANKKSWKKCEDVVLNDLNCSQYKSRKNYEVRSGKGWISSGRKSGKVVGTLWGKADLGLSVALNREFCRVLLFPSFAGYPVQLTTKYGGQKSSKSLSTIELMRVKEPVHCFDEPKNYKVTSDLNMAMAQEDESVMEFFGK